MLSFCPLMWVVLLYFLLTQLRMENLKLHCQKVKSPLFFCPVMLICFVVFMYSLVIREFSLLIGVSLCVYNDSQHIFGLAVLFEWWLPLSWILSNFCLQAAVSLWACNGFWHILAILAVWMLSGCMPDSFLIDLPDQKLAWLLILFTLN